MGSELETLVADLEGARRAFVEALDDLEPALRTTPGMVGEWSAAQVVAHLGYWAGHATEALHHAEQDRLDEFGRGEPEVDETNAVVARIAAETDLATILQREEAAFLALVTFLRRADPEWLDERSASGDTLGEVIHDDGADHYREHTFDLRAWFTGDDGDD
jgi:DinB superfamily